MQPNVILTADSTCDLGDALKEQYGVHYFPYHIILDGKQYTDGVDITPEELYQAWYSKKILPTTAAANPDEYASFFKKFVSQGYEVVHLSLGSGLSAGYQNSCIAAAEVGHVFPVDSCNLSSGIGLLVIEAAERIGQGLGAETIAKEIRTMVHRVRASFVIDTLTFLHAGGRCSTLTHFGSNLLHIKPCIEVKTQERGNMGVGKKYHGDLSRVLVKYTNDLLDGRTDLKQDHVFITHSGIHPDSIELVRKTILEHATFDNIHITRSCCTIASHCGPNTLGVLFMTK